MSRKAANRIPDLETPRIAQLNPGRTDIAFQTIGFEIVCSVLVLFADEWPCLVTFIATGRRRELIADTAS